MPVESGLRQLVEASIASLDGGIWLMGAQGKSTHQTVKAQYQRIADNATRVLPECVRDQHTFDLPVVLLRHALKEPRKALQQMN